MLNENLNDYSIITVDEVASELQVGINAAYNLLKENKIKNFKIGKTYKVTRAALYEYIISQSGLNVCKRQIIWR